MADNYLEKKMEEHQRGGAVSRPVRRLSPSGAPQGTVCLKIDALRVFVSDCGSEFGAAIVRRLRQAACRVAFTAPDQNKGRELAQSTGSRYYPPVAASGAAADLASVWGGIDVLVLSDGKLPEGTDLACLKRVIVVGPSSDFEDVEYQPTTAVNSIDPLNFTPEQVAHIALLLCLADSSCINGVNFRNPFNNVD